MLLERLEAAKQDTANRSRKRQSAINTALRVLSGAEVAEPWESRVDFIHHQAENTRQAELLAKLFAEELGMKEVDYRESLPSFGLQPTVFKFRFDVPLIVETRIPLKRQCELARLTLQLGGWEMANDWPKDPQGFKTPSEPYITWMHSGYNHGGIMRRRETSEQLRQNLADDERGATVLEGIALHISYPRITRESLEVSLPGSDIDNGYYVPLMYSGGYCGEYLGTYIEHRRTSGNETINSAICGRRQIGYDNY